MFYVYIVECADSTLYCGYTKNIAERIKAHNTSKTGAKYTKARRPVVLKHLEKFKNKTKALQREYQIKQLSRQAKLKLFSKNL